MQLAAAKARKKNGTGKEEVEEKDDPEEEDEESEEEEKPPRKRPAAKRKAKAKASSSKAAAKKKRTKPEEEDIEVPAPKKGKKTEKPKTEKPKDKEPDAEKSTFAKRYKPKGKNAEKWTVIRDMYNQHIRSLVDYQVYVEETGRRKLETKRRAACFLNNVHVIYKFDTHDCTSKINSAAIKELWWQFCDKRLAKKDGNLQFINERLVDRFFTTEAVCILVCLQVFFRKVMVRNQITYKLPFKIFRLLHSNC